MTVNFRVALRGSCGDAAGECGGSSCRSRSRNGYAAGATPPKETPQLDPCELAAIAGGNVGETSIPYRPAEQCSLFSGTLGFIVQETVRTALQM